MTELLKKNLFFFLFLVGWVLLPAHQSHATTYKSPQDFSIVCIELESGKTLWEQAPGPLRRPHIYVCGNSISVDDSFEQRSNLMNPVVAIGQETIHQYYLDVETGKRLKSNPQISLESQVITPLQPLKKNLIGSDGKEFIFDSGNTRHLEILKKGQPHLVRTLPDFPFGLNIVDQLAIFTFAGGISMIDKGGGIVYAYRYNLYHLAWKFDAAEYIDTLPENAWTGIAVDGDRILVSVEQVIFALDARSGELLWKTELPRQQIARFDMPWTTIAGVENRLIVNCYDNLFCLDRENGAMLWEVKGGFLSRPWPTMSEGKLLAGVRSGPVQMLSTSIVPSAPLRSRGWRAWLENNKPYLVLGILWLPLIVGVIYLLRLRKKNNQLKLMIKEGLARKKIFFSLMGIASAAYSFWQIYTNLLLLLPLCLFIIIFLFYLSLYSISFDLIIAGIKQRLSRKTEASP